MIHQGQSCLLQTLAVRVAAQRSEFKDCPLASELTLSTLVLRSKLCQYSVHVLIQKLEKRLLRVIVYTHIVCELIECLLLNDRGSSINYLAGSHDNRKRAEA